MVVLENLQKSFARDGGRVVVAGGITATLPGGVSIGLLGRNGAGKSTLLRMIAGTCRPDGGRVLTAGRISYPVGLASALHGDLTGAQNTRFVARLYGAETGDVCAFVEDFAELGAAFRAPVRHYSSGMKARLAFGINMALDFDTYLLDEALAAGDAAFLQKSRALLRARLARAGAIVVSHAAGQIRQLCEMGAVLEGGQLTLFDDVEAAIAHHERKRAA
ncbi:capsular polysaccharide transport system ATP-binding protein [Roseivivax lentus]|uniref:Capsular polysaccharide transport system ATP-binding protein n=1 Tax=Roseivivax lentus TaxID=633194 RepID=A0A1N7Q5M9_9RHOB|nr:ABC transporter ATP-binding protein [Roseivivax lentus]SIT18019.1 capsular polysaccharide transport system ATP-binding protein [Roseivivax lentus]